MQDIFKPEINQISLIMKETIYGFTVALKMYQLYMFLKTKDVIKKSQNSIKNKVHFVDTLS